MKQLILLTLLACFWAACGEAGGVNQSTPEETVQVIFDAAKSGKLEQLSGLCDPEGGNDGDTKNICNPGDMAEEFKIYFEKGKINGESKIEGDRASVPILFGPEGNDTETVKLVRRGDKWYLYSM